jgi:hypothetical protein
MKGWLIGVVLGLGPVTLVGAEAAEPGERNNQATGWLSDYATARTVARQSGKPIFLVFR